MCLAVKWTFCQYFKSYGVLIPFSYPVLLPPLFKPNWPLLVLNSEPLDSSVQNIFPIHFMSEMTEEVLFVSFIRWSLRTSCSLYQQDIEISLLLFSSSTSLTHDQNVSPFWCPHKFVSVSFHPANVYVTLYFCFYFTS